MITQNEKLAGDDVSSPEFHSGGFAGRPTKILLGCAAVILAAAAGISLYAPMGTAVYGPPIFPFAFAVFSLLVATGVLFVVLRWRALGSCPEFWAIPFAAAVGLSLLASPFPDRAAFPSLVLLLLPAAILLIAVFIGSAPDKVTRGLHFFRVTGVFSIGVAIWGLVSWAVVDYGTQVGLVDQLAGISGLQHSYPSLLGLENPHPFGHKNFAAGFAILTLPIVVALACLDQSRLRLLWLGSVPLVFLYLASAESRAGWLALVGGLVFLLLLRFLRRETIRFRWWHGAILAGLLLIPLLASPRLRESVQRMGQEGSLAALDPYRWEMAQVGIAVGNTRPLTGTGAGALSLVSPASQVSENYPVVYQVHSTPLQLYAETGLVGVLGCLLLGWGVVLTWRRTGGWRRSRLGDEGQILRDASVVAIVSYAILALTDYQLDVPAIVLAAAVPVGVLFGLGGKRKTNSPEKLAGSSAGNARPPRWQLAVAVVAGLLLVPLFWFNGKGFFARRDLHNATASLKAGDLGDFETRLQDAIAWATRDPFYLNQMANVWLTEWMYAEDAQEKEKFAESAVTALEKSLAIAPAQDSVHFNLGVMLKFQGELQAAASAFEQALEYNPRKRFANFVHGRLLLDLGKPQAAEEAFARELLVNPSSLFLPLWSSPEIEGLIEARNRHFMRLTENNPSLPVLRTRYLLGWQSGNSQAFAGELDKQPDGFRVLATALAGNPQAAVQVAPETPEAFLVRAWLDPENAERWLRAGFFKADRVAFSHGNLHAIEEILRDTETFSAGFRGLLESSGLPANSKRGFPRAAGLFEHNFYGTPLFDFFFYTEPIIFLLF